MPPKKSDDPHFRLRVPAELKQRIEEAASANNRSMNAEIVARLEGYDAAMSAWAGRRAEIEERDRVIEALENQVGAEKEQRAAALEKLYSESERINLLTYRRIPEGLYARLGKVAAANGRSIEEEVVQALEKAFPPPRLPAELRQIATMLEELLDRRRSTKDSAELQELVQSLRAQADEQEREGRS